MDSVKDYKKRRKERKRARMDAGEGGRWVTTENKHKIHINSGGEPDMGNPHVIAAMKSGGKKKTSLEKKADRFHNALKEWKDIDFPEDTSEAVGVEEYEKQKMKEKLDRFSELMREEENSGRRREKAENKEYGYGSGGDKKEATSYGSFPPGFRIGGRKYATADEIRQVRETVTRFMKNAKEGDVYSVGGGIGSAGGQKFKVLRRRGKLELAWQDSDGYFSRPVQMSRTNVEKFIGNGAKKVS